MSETISGARQQHCVSGAVEMRALRRAQELARGEAQLRIGVERADQVLDVVGLQLDVIVQEQEVSRVGRGHGAIDGSGRALVVGQFKASRIARKGIGKNLSGARFVLDDDDLPLIGWQGLLLDEPNAPGGEIGAMERGDGNRHGFHANTLLQLLLPCLLPHQARRRRRNCDVHVRHRAERAERLVEVLVVAHDQHSKLILVDILVGDAGNIVGRHLLHFTAIALQKIERIVIELVRHFLAQNFFRGVELEDERVQDVVLGALEFFRSRRLLQQGVNLVIEPSDSLDSGGALGLHANVGQARMVPAVADPAADRIRKSPGRAQVVE